MFGKRLAGYTGGHSYFSIRDDRTTYSYILWWLRKGALGQIALTWGQHYFLPTSRVGWKNLMTVFLVLRVPHMSAVEDDLKLKGTVVK